MREMEVGVASEILRRKLHALCCPHPAVASSVHLPPGPTRALPHFPTASLLLCDSLSALQWGVAYSLDLTQPPRGATEGVEQVGTVRSLRCPEGKAVE